MCKFIVWYMLNIMHKILAWIMKLVVGMDMLWYYEHNLELVINWWNLMIINEYEIIDPCIICIYYFCVNWCTKGQSWSFEWYAMEKNVEIAFCNSVTGITSEADCPSCIWVDWRSSIGWRGGHHGLQAEFLLSVVTWVMCVEGNGWWVGWRSSPRCWASRQRSFLSDQFGFWCCFLMLSMFHYCFGVFDMVN